MTNSQKNLFWDTQETPKKEGASIEGKKIRKREATTTGRKYMRGEPY